MDRQTAGNGQPRQDSDPIFETIEYDETLPFTAENGDCAPVEEWGDGWQ